jgi:DNA helicase IV
MDKPLWIEYILNSTQAYSSFLEYIEITRALKVEELIAYTKSGSQSQATSITGHIEFIDHMKTIVESYRKEEEENAAISQQT